MNDDPTLPIKYHALTSMLSSYTMSLSYVRLFITAKSALISEDKRLLIFECILVPPKAS